MTDDEKELLIFAQNKFLDAFINANINSIKRDGRILGIFKQKGIWAKLDYIFWRTLCPRPDGSKIGMWWYGKSAHIAGYFHKKHCKKCFKN